MEHEGRLLTVRELRKKVGEEALSGHMAYAIARLYGFRLGRKLVVPDRVLEDLVAGRLDLEAILAQARKRAGRTA
ncbi:MAG: hypothetical protein ACP5JV_06770 [Thermus sp.]|uniref:hypothetical protein n=1 Tax=Thermus sp. TaxID=275 RepID=UPI003D097D53